MTQIDKAKNAIATTRVRTMSIQVAEVRQNINIIHEALKSVMKVNVHYGTIPGCPKPSLYKPGAEVIMALFRLSADPDINDLSKDGEIRYQVKVKISAKDGTFVGSGIGECSSGEEKYMWRAAVSNAEFDATLETMRRIKYRKDGSEVQQVRVPPADLANTILKMAKKRALIDAVLTATAASDIFSQDIEEIPEEVFVDNTTAPEGSLPDKPSQAVECASCAAVVTDKVAAYSKTKFGRVLCFNCQKANQ